LIASFLSNISAKYYQNPAIFSRVIAKNIGSVFLRHSVVQREKVAKEIPVADYVDDVILNKVYVIIFALVLATYVSHRIS